MDIEHRYSQDSGNKNTNEPKASIGKCKAAMRFSVSSWFWHGFLVFIGLGLSVTSIADCVNGSRIEQPRRLKGGLF
jgi:hypothetical protein